MSTLIRSELKKIFTAKLFVFFFVLLLFFDVCTIVLRFGIYYSFSLQGDAESAIMRRTAFAFYEGELTDEKLDQINDRIAVLSAISDRNEAERQGVALFTHTPGSDVILLQNILTDMNRVRTYSETLEEIRAQAEALRKTAAERGNTYLCRVCELTEKVYTNRNTEQYYQTDSFAQYLSYDFSSFMIILMLLLGVSPIMASEKEIGIFPLLAGTRHGRTALVYAKLIATALLTAIICAGFFLADMVSFAVCLRLKGWSIPLFCLKTYEYTVFTGSVLAFSLLSMLIKYVGLLYIAALIFFLSALLKKSYLAFITGFAAITVCMLGKAYANVFSEGINLVNPVSLLLPRELLGAFSVVRVGSAPVYRWSLCIALCVFAAAALTVLIVRTAKKQTEGGRWLAVQG